MRRDSYVKVGAELAALASALAAVAAFGLKPPPKSPAPPPVAPVAKTAVAPPTPKPAPIAAEARTVVDERAIAEAEGKLRAARLAAMEAEAREALAQGALGSEADDAAREAEAYRVLAASARAPKPEMVAARQSGEVAKAEVAKLEGEVEALCDAPRPRRKVLIDKSPVAKKAEGEEFHFEVRGDRVAFIDLERLLDQVKTDARVQIRLSGGNRPAVGTVGPVGSFRMMYEVGRLDDGANPRMGSFGLSAWEIAGVSDARGETFASAMRPASDFARAIRRLNPTRDVVTLWIYPDGFATYRRIRDALHAEGFLVAARPLPSGMAIRGSPSGSSSSAQ